MSKSNLFESQLPFTQVHGNPGMSPQWKLEIKHKALSRAVRSPSIEHVNSNNGGMSLRGGSAEMTRPSLRCPRVAGRSEEGREGGLIEFEVGEAAEAFKVERGIGVEGGWGKGRVPVMVWEPNRTPTLQYLVEISNRLCFGTSYSRRFLRRFCTQGCR